VVIHQLFISIAGYAGSEGRDESGTDAAKRLPIERLR